MRKIILRLTLATLVVSALILTSFLTFRPGINITAPTGKNAPNTCGPMCSTILTDCFGGSGCTLPGCTGVWKVLNLSPNTYTPVNSATITFSVCHNSTGTPPWTSYTLVGKMMNSWFVPPATQTFNCTDGSGTVFKCTVTTTGNFYMQHFSGPVPSGSGITLTGTYGIKCGSVCNS